MYSIGDGIAQDKAESAKWYRLAIEQGHVEVKFTLANFYYNVNVVAQDKAKAAKLYCLAREPDLSKAKFYFANMYLSCIY
jgi:TPR repeat protein